MRDELDKEMQTDEMQKRRRDVMVACPFILPDHLLLGVVGFCDMTALYVHPQCILLLSLYVPLCP